MSIVKPARLYPGDHVGIIAPASRFKKRGFLRGIDKLRYLGFEPVYSSKIFSYSKKRPQRYQEKAKELIQMINDPTIGAIFCAEGGYGSIALIAHLEKVDLSAHPKIIVGFSDITILLLYFHMRYGWMTFHGPTIASELYKGMPPHTEESFFQVLTQGRKLGDLAKSDLEIIKTGEAKGRLIGGNLTRMISTLGTPFEINTHNRVLFIEEIDEGYIALESALNHLKLAGKLEKVKGVVFSKMIGCLDNSPQKMRMFLKRFFRKANYPVLYGFPSGHGIENLTIPIGARVSMSSISKRLIFEEGGVS
jgi:muramoyltetrapeptide carboxypeptidase